VNFLQSKAISERKLQSISLS